MVKKEDYIQLLEELETTGNVYSTNISISRIDENPAKKTNSDIADDIKIGENIYYIQYTRQIEDEFDSTPDGIIRLAEGDYVKVEVENTNETIYQMMQRSLYSVSGGKMGRISGKHTALVLESTDGRFVTIR